MTPPFWIRSMVYGALAVAPALVVFGPDPSLWPASVKGMTFMLAVEVTLFIEGVAWCLERMVR